MAKSETNESSERHQWVRVKVNSAEDMTEEAKREGDLLNAEVLKAIKEQPSSMMMINHCPCYELAENLVGYLDKWNPTIFHVNNLLSSQRDSEPLSFMLPG